MVAKCANPPCPSKFRYFQEGKLFHVAILSKAQEKAAHRMPRHERFWLCGACSREMTVIAQPEGIAVVPLPDIGKRQERRRSSLPAPLNGVSAAAPRGLTHGGGIYARNRRNP
jgi:hypothetical protein